MFCRFGYCTVMATTRECVKTMLPSLSSIDLMSYWWSRPVLWCVDGQSSDVSKQTTLLRRHWIFLWMYNFIVIMYNKFSILPCVKIIKSCLMSYLADARHLGKGEGGPVLLGTDVRLRFSTPPIHIVNIFENYTPSYISVGNPDPIIYFIHVTV
jgi:hypothetical protein